MVNECYLYFAKGEKDRKGSANPEQNEGKMQKMACALAYVGIF